MCGVKWEKPDYLGDLSVLEKYEGFGFERYLNKLEELVPYLQKFFDEFNEYYEISCKLVSKNYYYFTSIDKGNNKKLILLVLLTQLLRKYLHCEDSFYECNRRVVLKFAVDIYWNNTRNVQKNRWRLEIRLHNDNITGREALEFFGMSFFHLCERLEGLDCDEFKYEGSEGVKGWVLALLERVKRAMIEDSKKGKESYIWRVIHECCWPYKMSDVDKECK